MLAGTLIALNLLAISLVCVAVTMSTVRVLLMGSGVLDGFAIVSVASFGAVSFVALLSAILMVTSVLLGTSVRGSSNGGDKGSKNEFHVFSILR